MIKLCRHLNYQIMRSCPRHYGGVFVKVVKLMDYPFSYREVIKALRVGPLFSNHSLNLQYLSTSIEND